MQTQRIALLEKFRCTGASCEDTCCRGWGMQVDAGHVELYREKAPELAQSLEPAGSAYHMRRDKTTGFCVKFTDGLCGIQNRYGEAYLGDACHFYPRVTRRLGGHVYMAATLSCPEIVRLALREEAPFARQAVEIERLPVTVKDYLPEGLTTEQAEKVVDVFLREAAREDITPEMALGHILTVSRSLNNLPLRNWPEAAAFFMRTAADRPVTPARNPADPYRLLHALAVLVGSNYPKMGKRFHEVFARMERALDARIDWRNLLILNNSRELNAFPALVEKWRQGEAEKKMAPLLRRWLQAQLAQGLFPFAGAGGNPLERATILAVRFALLRLALLSLMGENGSAPEEADAIQAIQSLARVLDHMESADLALTIYTEAEWLKESRMAGLINL